MGFSDHRETVIMDALTDEIVGMARTFEQAYLQAEQWLSMRHPDRLPILRRERSQLPYNGKDNAGRFYTAVGESGLYLAVYTMQEDYYGHYTDKQGIVRTTQ